MKRIFLLSIFALIVCSCSQNGRKISIRVSTDNSKEDQYVTITSLSSEIPQNDTLFFKNNGKGSEVFTSKIKIPTYYAIIPQNGRVINLLAKPGEKIKIHTDNLNFDNWTIKGSRESEGIIALDSHVARTVEQIDSLNNVLASFVGNPNFENIRIVLEMNYNQLMEDQKKFNSDFIEENLGSMSAIYALFQRYPDGSFVFGDADDLKWFTMVDSALYSNMKYRSSAYIRMMHVNVEEIKAQHRQNKMEEMMTGLGDQVPEINLPSVNGKNIALSSLRGKYVLVDFWAGWCMPCRNENPNIKNAYEKYSGEGFDVYQVSLDRDRNQWEKAIKDDGLESWHHVSDLKYWDSSVVELFNISSIPANILIDGQGTIIAKNLRGEALMNKLAEIFESSEDGE